MKNILLIFGGESTEHDISIITAMQVYDNLDKDKYFVFPVYIDKKGDWNFVDNFISIKDFLSKTFNNKTKCSLLKNKLVINSNSLFRKKIEIDYALIAMHGINGEDGSVASVLNLCHIPVCNCGIEASAICLNKSLFKNLLIGFNVNCLRYCNLIKSDYLKIDDKNDLIDYIKKLNNSLDFPLIVKPSKLGSSIGIKNCKNLDDLISGVDCAFNYSDEILIEECLVDFREFNIAIYKVNDKNVFSEIEEVKVDDEFLSFDDKYLNGGECCGMESMKKNIPAKISKTLKDEIVRISKLFYNNLNMKGVVRFDFLYDNITKILYLNEINTIPGSYAYYLFKNKDISFSKMLDDLIENCRSCEISDLNISKVFESSVLQFDYNFMKK